MKQQRIEQKWENENTLGAQSAKNEIETNNTSKMWKVNDCSTATFDTPLRSSI